MRASLLEMLLQFRAPRLPDVLRNELESGRGPFSNPFRPDMRPIFLGPDEDIDLVMETELPPPAGYRARPPPAYIPPPPAPEGFTRTAGEDELVVCPNCDRELGTGDDDLQKQIWVTKPCGHVCHPHLILVDRRANPWVQVYCGLCTKNRASSRGKKADKDHAEKTKPFSKCVVPDCGKAVSQPRAMFQLYL